MSRRRYVMLGLGLIVALASLLQITATEAINGSYIGRPFRQFYREHQGMRVLGAPQTGIREVAGYPAQYFEKGRLEEHRDARDAAWRLMYGRLTAAEPGEQHQSDLRRHRACQSRAGRAASRF